MNLPLPIGNERDGHDDERRASASSIAAKEVGIGIGSLLVGVYGREKRDGLQRLAETHIVRQDSATAMLGESEKPLDARLLIGAHFDTDGRHERYVETRLRRRIDLGGVGEHERREERGVSFADTERAIGRRDEKGDKASPLLKPGVGDEEDLAIGQEVPVVSRRDVMEKRVERNLEIANDDQLMSNQSALLDIWVEKSHEPK